MRSYVALAAGLGLVVAWSTLPIRDADRAARLVIVTACALALGYKLLSVLHYSGRERRSMHS